jgi:hypothetical protein
MRAKDALAQLYGDGALIADAGPAVLRLKLLEADWLAQDRRLSEDMREAARLAAADLRRLIQSRPCVSLIDHRARAELTEPVREPPPPPCIARAGRA